MKWVTQLLLTGSVAIDDVKFAIISLVGESLLAWDKSSITIRGERNMFLSVEFHPFRLPSPGLWLDIFQKIKAMGFLACESGHIKNSGVYNLEGFFDAAKRAGIYLLARPGPYINSEVSGGGFPGWLQRNKGVLRATAPDFRGVLQITFGTLEESSAKQKLRRAFTFCLESGTTSVGACVDKSYMQWIEREFRFAEITVPFINNDGVPTGNFVPGSGPGEVDIYGFDFYPFGWASLKFRSISLPSSPIAAVEFQGGTGGVGVETAAALINHEFARVFYKINYGLHTAIMNLYMTYGGTNWGNIGHPLGYTSYDMGAAISEDRQLVREKYSELKLQANYLRSSPAYLTASPQGDM
ncbi:glycoside hydrolase family 35 protein [Macroventuria anomochaeta]|uniref:Glycoside hydrolase family 35 protein n=1 Tax=Macroventuria anomochaeta TaxID=301207 RepID=A0ACB6SDQ9_9PLEO|nr:glycoside hydrolase family 35 protein [Macroventuria anomochaeta]KAF2632356.1 glycoside hydrolase family 35 protein [Macroventuria anomochaeta]